MTDTVRQVLAADAFAPSLARRRFRAWLYTLGWPRDETDELLLAISEAVSNVTDHAYPAGHPGEVTIDASVAHDADMHRVRVTVADRGTWRPPPSQFHSRGRGLAMMRATTASLSIEATAAGTHVIMVSRPARLRTPSAT